MVLMGPDIVGEGGEHWWEAGQQKRYQTVKSTRKAGREHVEGRRSSLCTHPEVRRSLVIRIHSGLNCLVGAGPPRPGPECCVKKPGLGAVWPGESQNM